MTESAWKIQDKEWMKQRQERWKEIQTQLKSIIDYAPHFKADTPYHKAYFLKGRILPIDEKWAKTRFVRPKKFGIDESSYGKPFSLGVYYKVWYYPEVDEFLFKFWCEEADIAERYQYCLSIIGFSREVEFFADRSFFLDKYWAPKTYQELLELDQKARPKGGNWISQSRALQMLLDRIRRGVFAYHNSVINAHMGYVTDNFIMCFALPLLRDLLSIDGILSPDLSEKLVKIMNCLVTQPPPPEGYSWGVAARLHRELTEFFDGGVSPQIDDLWEQIKLGKFAG